MHPSKSWPDPLFDLPSPDKITSELMMANPDRSMHQDVPLYSVDLFAILAPDELKTKEILNDPHQLIITRLNFELTERQR